MINNTIKHLKRQKRAVCTDPRLSRGPAFPSLQHSLFSFPPRSRRPFSPHSIRLAAAPTLGAAAPGDRRLPAPDHAGQFASGAILEIAHGRCPRSNHERLAAAPRPSQRREERSLTPVVAPGETEGPYSPHRTRRGLRRRVRCPAPATALLRRTIPPEGFGDAGRVLDPTDIPKRHRHGRARLRHSASDQARVVTRELHRVAVEAVETECLRIDAQALETEIRVDAVLLE